MQINRIPELALAVALALGATGVQADEKAAEVVAAARKALGGEKSLAALKSFSLRASYRRELANGPGPLPAGAGANVTILRGGAAPEGPQSQVAGDIEIDVQFPNKYIKADTSTGAFAMSRVEGFEGDRAFADISTTTPGVLIMGMKPNDGPDAAKMILRRTRADLARLLLGVLAGTQPDFPVTFTYVARAESPDGTADVLDVRGPDDFQVRLFVDAEAHLPLMLTYMAPEPRISIRTVKGDRPDVGRGEALPVEHTPAQPPKMIEYRLYFSDYRNVDGLRLPHHVTRGTATATTEEWDVRSYKLNPQFKPDRFKVS